MTEESLLSSKHKEIRKLNSSFVNPYFGLLLHFQPGVRKSQLVSCFFSAIIQATGHALKNSSLDPQNSLFWYQAFSKISYRPWGYVLRNSNFRFSVFSTCRQSTLYSSQTLPFKPSVQSPIWYQDFWRAIIQATTGHALKNSRHRFHIQTLEDIN